MLEKIIDTEQRTNVEIENSDIRQSIIKLARDIEETIRNNEDLCQDTSSSVGEMQKELITQMSEVIDFINLPAKDQFLDQCLLFLAIRIIELRSKIMDFKNSKILPEQDHYLRGKNGEQNKLG